MISHFFTAPFSMTSPIYGGGGAEGDGGGFPDVGLTGSSPYHRHPPTASGPPDRLSDESVSLHSQSPAAPYECSSLTFPSKEGGLGCFGGEAAGPQLFFLNSQI